MQPCYPPEPELGASRGQWLDDAADIVTDKAEAGDLAVALHGAPQGVLGILPG